MLIVVVLGKDVEGCAVAVHTGDWCDAVPIVDDGRPDDRAGARSNRMSRLTLYVRLSVMLPLGLNVAHCPRQHATPADASSDDILLPSPVRHKLS